MIHMGNASRLSSTVGELGRRAACVVALVFLAAAGAASCGSSESSSPGGTAGSTAGSGGNVAGGNGGILGGNGGILGGAGGGAAGDVGGGGGILTGGSAGSGGVAAGGSGGISGAGGQNTGGTVVPSNRVKINLGQTAWKFNKGDVATMQDPAFNDSSWKDVGVPYTWSDNETFLNKESGGPGPGLGGTGCYRKHFTLDAKYASRKIFVEFEGAHMGVQVYINGTLIPGNSAVNPNATHVVGFIPFIVDITKYAKFGGADNVLAVRTSMDGGGFFQSPTFSYDFRFGQGSGGLFRPVYMHITDQVYVPANVYSVVNNWGTYVATVSASDATAKVRIMTNVQNDTAQSQSVTLTVKVLDAAGKEVLVMPSTQAVEAGKAFAFDQTGDIANPHLWYPANSTYGGPYLYRVLHIVQVGGVTVDAFESPLGIRTITWDANFPYVNGKKFYFWGASGRYDYPALGTAVPEEQQWRDVKLMVEGGNTLFRPGHSTGSPELTAACDAYGVMLAQPSGELEGNFATAQLTAGPTPTYKRTIKTECHRDMIVRDRNNPSILMWEVSNGPIDPTFAGEIKDTVEKVWDPTNTRAMTERGNGYPPIPAAEVTSCSATGCEIGLAGNTTTNNKPAWGAEGWGGKRSTRFAYDYELAFAGEYFQNWKKSRKADAFGLAHWYIFETPGEAGSLLEGGASRNFGSSTMDYNRIPKLLYHMYRVAWIPFEVKPGIVIAHHWNRSGNVRVNVFSNCPKVDLKINGASQGQKAPNPWNTTTDGNGQTSTDLPLQAYWDVAFAPGTLRAECLDAAGAVKAFDEKVTAGAAAKIVLSVEPPLVKPSGEAFAIKANGSDAAFILAKVTDANGNWVPTANNVITFAVSGAGEYRGGSDQLIGAGGLNWHSPGDPNLNAEGGMCKIAVKSTFAPGPVTVTATAAGLASGTATFTTVAPP